MFTQTAAKIGAVFLGLTLLPIGPALADPPPWAYRHGWHDHGRWHGGNYVFVEPPPVYSAYPAPAYSAYPAYPVYESNPYVQVTCGPQPILGTIIGGVAGGLIGNQFGRGGGHAASIIGGSVLGLA